MVKYVDWLKLRKKKKENFRWAIEGLERTASPGERKGLTVIWEKVECGEVVAMKQVREEGKNEENSFGRKTVTRDKKGG